MNRLKQLTLPHLRLILLMATDFLTLAERVSNWIPAFEKIPTPQQNRFFMFAAALVRRQITNLSNAIAESGHSRALLTRLDKLELQETGVQNTLAALDDAEREVPPVTPGRAEQLIQMLDVVFPLAEIQTRRHILRGLVARVDVDRDGRRIFGVITVNYPPGDDDFLSEVLPPTLQTGGGQNVRMLSKLSGPPRYTHSFDLEIKIDGLSGRYKNSHS